MVKYIVLGIIAVIILAVVGMNFFLSTPTGADNGLLQKYYDELAANPNNAKAYMEIARDNITAYPKPYNTDKALDDINMAIKLDPSLTEAYQLRAMLYYYTIKDSDKALEDIEKILELEPNNDFALDLKKDILSEK